MTPALPGETPDPSAMPRLDALIKEVEAAHPNATRMQGVGEDFVTFWHRVHTAEVEIVDTAPRLAAMLRVAVEALRAQAFKEGDRPVDGSWDEPGAAEETRAALARIEAMAKGEP